METKDLLELKNSLEKAWETFSDAADFRKKIDESYGKMLSCRKQLLYYKGVTHDEHDREQIERILSDIDNFYHTDRFPDWRSYDRESHIIDQMRESVSKYIESSQLPTS